MKIDIDNLNDLAKKGIYSITNTLNNKKYIGSTAKSFKSRLTQHLSKLRLNKHHCVHLQYAWNKYGEDVFQFHIEEIIEDTSMLLDKEAEYIKKYDSYHNGYNANPNPNTSPMFNINSREKSSRTHKELWSNLKSSMSESEYHSFIQERYKDRIGKEPINKGKCMSEEAKEKMRKPKINGISQAMKAVHLKNAEIIKEKSDYILVYDINKKWINTFRCNSDLVEYSKSKFNNLPLILRKGGSRILDSCKIANHIKSGTPYKGLYLMRAPKSRKLSCANGMNSWKAEKPIMSQAVSTLTEGAETTGEVQPS
jgi:group I intron endonuclease